MLETEAALCLLVILIVVSGHLHSRDHRSPGTLRGVVQVALNLAALFILLHLLLSWWRRIDTVDVSMIALSILLTGITLCGPWIVGRLSLDH